MIAALFLATLFVTNERAGTVSVIDTDTDTIVATKTIGNRPRGIAVSGGRIYIAVSQWRDRPRTGREAIVALDTKTFAPVREYKSGTDPEVVTVSPDGKRLYLSNEDAGNASVVDVATGRHLATLIVGTEPEGVTVSPNGKLVYVACESSNTVTVIDAKAQKVIANILVDARPRATIFSRDGRRAWVTSELRSSIALVDPSTHRVLKRLKLTSTDRPVGMVLSPDEKRIYVATGRGNSVLVLDREALKVTTRIATGARPWYLALTPDGRKLYVANNLSNTISVIDTGTLHVVKTIVGGDGPWGVALSR